MPKVSILIPTYNNPIALKRAIESCLKQTYKDYEIIITDDSTNDETEKLYNDFWQQNKKIKYFHNKKPLGSPKNWNCAISKAQGEYIKILHHDDWFNDVHSLEKFVNALELNPNADFAYSQSVDVAENGAQRFHDFGDKVTLIKNDIYTLFPDNFIGAPSATIYRKNNLLFDEKLKWLVDIDFYIKILQKNPNFIYIPDVCVNIGISSVQVTQICFNNPKVELFEFFYVFEKYKQYFSDRQDKLKVLKCILKKYSHHKNVLYIEKYLQYKLNKFIALINN